ncbi:hypothetical protein WBP06_23205 [Novosphingobium sp. BL-8H]|uniref:hypothetical protein n=1 Tax=Novosphingobium sp. BL-8H TaxID=3127640 RepID=UPI0037563A39
MTGAIDLISALLLLAASSAGSGQDDKFDDPAARACRASLSVVQSIVNSMGSNLIFGSWVGQSSSQALDAEYQYDWAKVGRPRRGVSPPGASEMRLMKPKSGFSAVERCPEIRDYLRRNRIQFGEEAVRQAYASRSPSGVTFVSVSLAIIAPTGNTSVITTSFGSLELGGGGWVSVYSRANDATWVEAYIAPTSIG